MERISFPIIEFYFEPAVVEECAQRQEEELFLLQSMYTDEELTIEGKTITVTLSPKATVVFHLPPDYPTESLFKGTFNRCNIFIYEI